MRRHTVLTLLATTACAIAPAPATTPQTDAPVPTTQAPGACSDTTRLVVATTTDVHGRLRGWDYELDRLDTLRGLSRAATVVDSLRAANPGRVILLDAGDLLQGNMLAYVAARVASDTTNPIVAAMNVMRYDAAAIGNHEYNYGIPYLDRAVRQASFPFLSANTYRPDGSHAYAPWVIVERAGVKVGIVGATTPGVMVWDRDHVRGRVTLGDIVPAVGAAAIAAHRAGAEVLVVTVHSGLDERTSYDTVTTGLPSENVAARIAREVPGPGAAGDVPPIALVVYGHSHKLNPGSTVRETRMLQAKNWAQTVGVATLPVIRCAGSVRVLRQAVTSASIAVSGRAEHPGVVAATEPWHRRTIAYVTDSIGATPVTWRGDSARVRDTPVVDFMLEVMRATAKTQLAAGSAFTFAGLDSGAISIAELARIYPYDNTLRAVKVSGAQLRAYLEQAARYYGTFGDSAQPVIDPRIPGYNFDIVAGADYVLDISRPVGSRVRSLRVGRRAVQPTDTFTLALNNYRQAGGGGYAMLAGAPVIYEGTEEIRLLLEREVRRRRVIRPRDYFRQNWRIEPAAAVARAYERMHRTAFDGERAAPPRSGDGHVRIIATNDFHGALEPRADSRGIRRGGAAHVATAIARASVDCRPPSCATLVLDGGDQWQGTPASNLAFGLPVVKIFERWGTAAAALGNHEFDWGQDTLRARMRDAHHAILGANVRDSAGRDVAWIRNDTIVTRGRFRVGIVGIATVETPRVTRASNVSDLRFLPPAPIVDSTARALRGRGADVVVVIAHAGAFCDSTGTTECDGEIVALARALREPVDAIVSGHTHSLVDAVINGMPIVQARSRGQAIAVADIHPSRRGAADANTARVIPVLTDSLPADSAVQAIVERALATVGTRMRVPVATIAAPLRREGAQHALGHLVADAQRWAGKADVGIMNRGGIRADLPAGQATFGALYEVQPFGNVLNRFVVDGARLRRYVERLVAREQPAALISGLIVRYDSRRPAGSRIVSLETVDGGAVRDDGRYSVVMSDFLATGGDELALDGVGTPEDLRVVDVDALRDYLRQLPQPVQPPRGDRFIDIAAAGAP